jgi:predicted nucleotidyltransferase
MFLSKLFSSDEKINAISTLFYDTTDTIKIREIARRTATSPSLVSNTVELLKKEGIVKKGKVDLLNPKTRAVKLLLNTHKISSAGLTRKITGLFKNCKGIGMYGSWAEGTNQKDSDLDIWIKTEETHEETQGEIRKFVKDKLKTDVGIVFLTEKKLETLKKNDPAFYSALHHSFVLWGESI